MADKKKRGRISDEKKEELALNNFVSAHRDIVIQLMNNPPKLELVKKII